MGFFEPSDFIEAGPPEILTGELRITIFYLVDFLLFLTSLAILFKCGAKTSLKAII